MVVSGRNGRGQCQEFSALRKNVGRFRRFPQGPAKANFFSESTLASLDHNGTPLALSGLHNGALLDSDNDAVLASSWSPAGQDTSWATDEESGMNVRLLVAGFALMLLGVGSEGRLSAGSNERAEADRLTAAQTGQIDSLCVPASTREKEGGLQADAAAPSGLDQIRTMFERR